MELPNWIRYIFPKVVWTTYGEKNEDTGEFEKTFCIWKQWLNFCYVIERFKI